MTAVDPSRPPTRLLIVGNDKLGRTLAARVRGLDDLAVYRDESTDWRRVLRLVRRGRLRIAWLTRMAWAEAMRQAPAVDTPGIRTNDDIVRLVAQGVRQIFLFRAGLILSRAVIESGADVLNMHCASLPAYGGIGALCRALADGAHAQVATLHRVTRQIDDGPIIATEPYVLNPARTYRDNEDAAYAAGMNLLEAVLSGRRAIDLPR